MSYNENEFGCDNHMPGLRASRSLPSRELIQSLVSLQEKDPIFFEIASGIVSDEVHANKRLHQRVGRLARKYDGGTQSVNEMYRLIDQVEAAVPFASAELARQVIRREILGSE